MKILLGLVVLVLATACEKKSATVVTNTAAGDSAVGVSPVDGASVQLDSLQAKYSYALGFQVGQNIGQQGESLDKKAFLLALGDVFNGTEARLNNDARRQALQKMAQQRRERQDKAAVVNLEKSTAYLEKNKKQKGVKVTKSGLQYRVIKRGTGKRPTQKSFVKVHYRGKLIDGTEFDSSHKRGQPARFPVGGVIPGWTEALKMMPVGSEWELVIPPNLGYGDRNLPNIPSQSTLVFNVQLLGIEDATAR